MNNRCRDHTRCLRIIAFANTCFYRTFKMMSRVVRLHHNRARRGISPLNVALWP
ncbi:Uncharacterised protein [Vibrio cholerae]|nr:Uncharacterised protein [Vibrio cholerae]